MFVLLIKIFVTIDLKNREQFSCLYKNFKQKIAVDSHLLKCKLNTFPVFENQWLTQLPAEFQQKTFAVGE